MSTSLVTTRAPNALVSFEGVDAAILPITAENVELIQANSRAEGGILGKFRNKETGNHVEEFLAVPISLYTNRVLFPPTPVGAAPQFGQRPLCRSNDGIRPADNVIDKKSKLCSTKAEPHLCSFGMWKNIGGKKIKPPCQLKLIFTFMELNTFKVFKFAASGTAISPLEHALKNIKNEVASAHKVALMAKRLAEASGLEYNEPTLKLGLDSFVIKIKPAKVIATTGVYYTVNFTPMLADHKNAEVFRGIYKETVEGLDLAYRIKPPTDEDGDEYVDVDTQFSQDVSAGSSEAEPVIEA